MPGRAALQGPAHRRTYITMTVTLAIEASNPNGGTYRLAFGITIPVALLVTVLSLLP
jgi:hypothetical protein